MNVISEAPILKVKSQPKIKKQPRSTPFALRLVRFAFTNIGPLFPKLAASWAYKLFTTPRKRAKHFQSDSILEQAKIFEVLYGKRMLKAYEWGRGDKIVLLVHGWESRGTALRSFVPSLLQAGFKVVAFDGPAHGNSEGQQTNLPHFGGAVRAMINQLGGVHSIICHSFGGASTVYALARLDNSIAIESLVLIGTPSDMKTVMRQFFNTIAAPPSVQNAFYKLISKKFNFQIENTNVDAMLPDVKVHQTMIVHDQNDEAVAYSEGMSNLKAAPNGSLLKTEGFGHFKLMKEPEVIDRVVEFIADKF